MSDQRNTPTITEAVDARIEAKLRDLNTVSVGRIESYDDSSGRASVQLIVERVRYGEDGERETAKRPLLVEVPIVYLGASTRLIKYLIGAGDLAVVMFAQHSLDRLLAVGGDTIDPGDERRHHLSDAIAITGFARAVEDGDAIIEFKPDGTICIGAGVFLATPGGDRVVKEGAIDPFTGQPQYVINAGFLTQTLLAK
jgi:hypothetical protein